ncbi:MAG: hypothetical protein C0453_18090, partial [Comamonadaceae bacterium]|nr:hypothetical protein [Comamonadaceae bacterium]
MNAATPTELQALLKQIHEAEDIDNIELDLADDAVRRFPDAPEAWHTRAFLRLAAGNEKGARDDLIAAQKLSPSHAGNAWIQCVLAQVRGSAGHQEAVTHGQAVLARDPGHFGALIALGKVCEAQGDVDGAVDHWRRAVQARPHSFRAHNALIKLLCAHGRYDEAVALIRHAELPMHSYGMAIEYNMGTLLLNEQPAKAIEFLDTARRKMGEVN